MIIEKISKKDVIEEVKSQIEIVKREILVTMLLKEEVKNPLPGSYQKLLRRKTAGGVFLTRLGFGSKEEYNHIRQKYFYRNNYSFSLIQEPGEYQRMIIIDDRIVFFKIETSFFKSNNKLVVKAFKAQFNSLKKKGTNG